MQPYSWDTEFSLLTDRFVLWDFGKLLAWTYGIIVVMFSVILLVTGEPEDIPSILRIFAIVLGGFAILFVLIMLVVFRNRFQARATISDDGVMVASTSRIGKFFNRFAVVAGALGRSPGTAGAGLLATSGETVAIEWAELHRIKEHRDQTVLSLMNSWRVVVRLYCTPENYGTVLTLVRRGAAEGAATREREARTAGPSQVPRLLKLSGLALFAAALVAPIPFDVSPMPVAVALVAAIAAIWVPVIGRVAGLLCLGAVALVLVGVLGQGFEVHQLIPESVLEGQPAPEWGKYSGWSTLEPAEWIRFGVALAGLAGLAVIGFRALQGRLIGGRG